MLCISGSYEPLQTFSKFEFCVDSDGVQTTANYWTEDGLLPCYIEGGCTDYKCLNSSGLFDHNMCRKCEPVCNMGL